MVHFWTLDGGDRSNNLIPSIGGFVLQRLYVKYSMQLTEEGTTVVETLTLKFTFVVVVVMSLTRTLLSYYYTRVD